MHQLVITSCRVRLIVAVAVLVAATSHSARPMTETAMPEYAPDVPTLYLQNQPWRSGLPSF